MRVTISANHLKKAVRQLANISGNNTVLSIISSTKITVNQREMILEATDLETHVIVKIECQSMEDPFAFCIEVEELKKLCAQLPDAPIEVDFNPTDLMLTVITNIGKTRYATYKTDDFPKQVNPENRVSFPMDSQAIAELATAVTYVSKDTLRPAMTGVFFEIRNEVLNLIATDAHGLFHSDNIEVPGVENNDAVIPAKTAKYIVSLAETDPFMVHLVSTGGEVKHISFENSKITIYSRLVDAKFPDYKAVVPNLDKFFSINKTMMATALRFCSLSANATTHQVMINVQDSKAVFTAQDIDFSKEGETQPIELGQQTCDNYKIAFNADMLLALINDYDDMIYIYNDSMPTRACIFKNETSQNRYSLLMPLMIGI